jgi:hypothetical protein
MNRFMLVVPALLLAVLLWACGGSGGRGHLPYGDATEEEPDDVIEDGESPDGPTVTIISPAAGKILIGSEEMKFSLVDQAKKNFVKVTVNVVESGGKTRVLGEISPVPDPTAVVWTLDSSLVNDGSQTFLVIAETEDARKGQAKVKVTVDNHPPKIDFVSPPTPVAGSLFIGELSVTLRFDDSGGSGIKTGLLSVNGKPSKSFNHPKSGDKQAVTLPTTTWAPGEVTLTVDAEDNAGHKSDPVERKVRFVPSPAFESGQYLGFPADFPVVVAKGMRFNGAWVVAGGGSGGLRLFGRDAKGALVKKADVTTEGLSMLHITDLNGDGLDDVVVGVDLTEGGSLTVYLQAAGGKFTKGSTVTFAGSISSVATGDLNGDSFLDLVAGLNLDSSSVAVSLSTKKGTSATWSKPVAYGGMARPAHVLIGEFTGDERNDIFVVRDGTDVVTVFPVEADGTPSAGVNSVLEVDVPGSTIAGVTAALSAALEPSYPGAFAILSDRNTNRLYLVKAMLGTVNAGKVKVVGSLPTGLTPGGIVLADFDRDDLLDLAVFCKGANMVQVFWGDETELLVRGPAFVAGEGQTTGLVIADLTGDSYPDIAVLDTKGNGLTLIPFNGKNPAERSFLGGPMARIRVSPVGIAAGVFSVEGLTDVVVVGSSGNKPQVQVISSDGLLPKIEEIPLDLASLSDPKGLTAVDLNKDGYMDLLIPSSSSGGAEAKKSPTLGILMGQGSASFLDRSTFVGDSPTLAAVGEFDDNASEDLLDVVVISTYGKELRLTPHMGRKSPTGAYSLEPIGKKYTIPDVKKPAGLATARLDEDSTTLADPFLDLACANSATGDFTVYYGQGSGFFDLTVAKDYAVGPGPRGILAAKLEGPDDPIADIVTTLSSDIAINYAAQGSTHPSYEPPVLLGHKGGAPSGLSLADINRDGFIDIIVLNQGSNSLTVYLNLAKRTFSTPFTFPTGVGPTGFVVADIDGDGCLDIATADAVGMTITLLISKLCEK